MSSLARLDTSLFLLTIALMLPAAGPAHAEDGAAQPAGADAPGRTSSLSWVRLPGAETCIGTRALAEAVERRLQRPVIVSAAQADLSIEGRVEQLDADDGPRWRATVVVSDADGQQRGVRTIESPEGECGAIDEPLVLVIAVMIDPEAAMRPAEPEPAAAPAPAAEEPAAAAPPADPVRPPPEPPPPEPPRLRLDVTGSFIVGLGLLPTPHFGPALTFVVDPARFWPIELELGGFINAQADVAGTSGRARFDALYGAALLCVPWEPGGLRVHGCLGVQAGALQAQGLGFDVQHRRWRALANGLVRFRLLWNPVARFTVRVGATAVVLFVKDRFSYVDSAQVRQVIFEPWPVGVVFDVGVGVRF